MLLSPGTKKGLPWNKIKGHAACIVSTKWKTQELRALAPGPPAEVSGWSAQLGDIPDTLSWFSIKIKQMSPIPTDGFSGAIGSKFSIAGHK